MSISSSVYGLALVALFTGGGIKACSSSRSLIHSPAFKVGDCIALGSTPEDWETSPQFVKQVLELGKKKYRVRYVVPKELLNREDSEYFSSDDIYRKVECPK